MSELQALDKAYVANTYARFPVEIVSGKGSKVYDTDGNIVYDIACIRNGSSVSYAGFEAAYNELLMATVSGMLPQGWTAETQAHTAYTFTQVDGVTHKVELVHYDAFHDAVVLDGNAMFYLIKNGLRFGME